MGVAVADRGTRARGANRADGSAPRESGERLPLVVTGVALVVFAVAWVAGLLPALQEERALNARLTSAQQLEGHVRTQLEDRRQSLRAWEHDPEELIRALDETRTLPPAAAPQVKPSGQGSARTSASR